MIDRREQVLAHLVLGVFALIALAPVVRILVTALGEAGSFGTAWDDGHFGTYLRSSAIVTVSVVVVSGVLSVLAGYAFGTFWMRAFFRSVPRSLVEAARLDGSSTWTTLWRVVLPLGRPAVLTMVVLVFMWTWNEFLLALVMVSDESLRTAPLGLAFFQGRNTSDEALLAAGAVIVAAPVVLVYLFLQRHFIRGMLSGAVKA